jgi:hypothetical protein
MAKVKTDAVHAGRNQAVYRFGTVSGRANGGNNFSSFE